MKKNRRLLIILLAVLAIIIIISGVIFLAPHILNASKSKHLADFVNRIRLMGGFGIACFTLIQILQVVIFIIPGEVVELAGGILYGTFWGYIICTVGVILGSIAIYYISKKCGYNFIEKLHSKESFKKLKFLHTESKLEMCVFVLFLIPGTPKDVLTYFIPFTDMPLYKFLIISTIARFPSVITSTLTGHSFADGNIWLSIGVYSIVGLLGLAGIIINNKFIKAKQAQR